ncbi:MAG: carboxypeptidase regulatory-like domain-containing protein [Candidatus Edwardsbacteria bacterium]
MFVSQKRLASLSVIAFLIVGVLEAFAAPTGKICGKITSAKTNAPLSASVVIPSLPKDNRVTCNPRNGKFEISVPPGKYTVKIEMEGYETQALEVEVKKGEKVEKNISLSEKKIPKGTLTGVVRRFRDGKVLRAVIEFPNTEIENVMSDSENGIYAAVLPAGIYQIKISAEGYIPKESTVSLQEGKSQKVDFSLYQSGDELPLRVIQFEAKGSRIRSPQSLDELGRLLKGNSFLGIEIKGHVVSLGRKNQEISAERANAVKEYLVKNFNIEEERITAKGYGDTQPRAGTYKASPQNDRIEVVVSGIYERPQGILTGFVTDFNNKEPISSALVIPKGMTPVSCNKSGMYRLMLPPGEYSVAATADGYESAVISVQLAHKATKTLNFSLRALKDIISEKEKEVKKIYNKGIQLYDRRKYAEAKAEFENVLKMTPSESSYRQKAEKYLKQIEEKLSQPTE